MQVAKGLAVVSYVPCGAREPACTPSTRRHGMHDRQFERQFDCRSGESSAGFGPSRTAECQPQFTMQVAKGLAAVSYVFCGAREPECTLAARRHVVHDRQFRLAKRFSKLNFVSACAKNGPWIACVRPARLHWQQTVVMTVPTVRSSSISAKIECQASMVPTQSMAACHGGSQLWCRELTCDMHEMT